MYMIYSTSIKNKFVPVFMLWNLTFAEIYYLYAIAYVYVIKYPVIYFYVDVVGNLKIKTTSRSQHFIFLAIKRLQDEQSHYT